MLWSRNSGRWLTVALLLALSACGRSSPEVPLSPKDRVLIDLKSKKLYVVPEGLDSIPAPPRDAKLVFALYCPTCQEWYPVPPVEVIQRQPQAMLCPREKTPLVSDGPIPASATRLARP